MAPCPSAPSHVTYSVIPFSSGTYSYSIRPSVAFLANKACYLQKFRAWDRWYVPGWLIVIGRTLEEVP